jgi:lysophospholipase L1-like esterase
VYFLANRLDRWVRSVSNFFRKEFSSKETLLQRPPKSVQFTQSEMRPLPWHVLPGWVFVSLVINGLLAAVLMLITLRNYGLAVTATAPTLSNPRSNPASSPTSHLQSMLVPLPTTLPDERTRHQLTYQQWVDLLQQESKAVTEHSPQRLTIMAGDSLTLWFPPELLPDHRFWLNQGISGETSAGLLKRLDLFEKTNPETIFVMIGINDLIRQVKDETLLANQRLILQELRTRHPQAQIVLQSILPHGESQVTWEGQNRLLAISNQHIRDLNQQLRAIAAQTGVYFLDLHPLFTNAQGDLRPELSTDGLHLSPQGYLVWRTALEMYSQTELGADDRSPG